MMTKIILALVVVGLPTWAIAQQSDKPKKPPTSRTLRQVKGNPCAAYGGGFMKLEGSNTCVKIGGSVSFEAGSSVRR